MFKKRNKADVVNCIVLVSVVILVVLLITRFRYEYGSTLDWETQHYEIPNYFRSHFYETKDLFPDFAKNIGAGQNIYNYSYYGLYSPIILLSYLLPFVSMETYIQVISIIGVIASVLLCYYWLRGKYESRVAFLAAFLFECASPLILHSHRHIMFVNYMPFLIMALMGVDRYFEYEFNTTDENTSDSGTGHRHKKLLLITGIFLMIMSSYFFSVCGMFVVAIYGVCVYIKSRRKHTFKKFVFKVFNFGCVMLVPVLMAGILLLPTMYTLFHGRGDTSKGITIKQILLPSFNGDFILYSTYSVGMTSLIILALIYGFLSKMRHLKYTSTVMLCIIYIPAINYMFNGTMYVDGKAFIPFLPLCAYILASFFDKLKNDKIDIKQLVKWALIANLLLIISYYGSSVFLYVADLFISIIILLLYDKGKKQYFLPVTMIIAFAVCVVVNLDDELLEKPEVVRMQLKEADDDAQWVLGLNESARTANAVKQIRNMNRSYGRDYMCTTIYSSICNGYYKNFYYNEIGCENPYRNASMLCHPNNLLFDIYMGEKYYIGNKDEKIPAGYEKVYDNDLTAVYKNDDVFPLGFVKYDMIPESEYEKLRYPYRALALLKYSVVSDETFESYGKQRDYEKELSDLFTQADVSEIYENFKSIGTVEDDKVSVNIPMPEKHKKDRYGVTFKAGLSGINKEGENILFISCDVDNSAYLEPEYTGYGLFRKDSNGGDKHADVIIIINGYKNKLTNPNWKYFNENRQFHFCISDILNVDRLKLSFYDGNYTVANFNVWQMDYSVIRDIRKNISGLIADRSETDPDKIKGKIDVKEDGMFTISFPYDEGFICKVDGESVEYEKTDTGFIGFYITKGSHDIEIEYKAPYKEIGMYTSLAGFVIFAILILYEKGIIKRRSES